MDLVSLITGAVVGLIVGSWWTRTHFAPPAANPKDTTNVPEPTNLQVAGDATASNRQLLEESEKIVNRWSAVIVKYRGEVLIPRSISPAEPESIRRAILIVAAVMKVRGELTTELRNSLSFGYATTADIVPDDLAAQASAFNAAVQETTNCMGDIDSIRRSAQRIAEQNYPKEEIERANAFYARLLYDFDERLDGFKPK